MNERIEQFLQQVGTDTSGKWLSVEKAAVMAEMIIFECVKIAVFKGDNATAQAIKEHFEK